jgi:phage-related protein
MKAIHFYRSASGHCPVEVFLNSLTDKQAQKATWTLKLIEDMPVVPVQHFKKLTNTDGIWEVRVSSAGSIFRLLGFFDGESMVILNHAFIKKTQKTPKQAITLAEKRKADYLNRKYST